MDKQQTLSIIQLTATYFQNLKIENLKSMLEAWHYILVDYDFEIVLANLKAYVKAGNDFPPNVGHLLPQKERTIPTAAETQQMLLALDSPKTLPTEQELKNIFAEMDKLLKVQKG